MTNNDKCKSLSEQLTKTLLVLVYVILNNVTHGRTGARTHALMTLPLLGLLSESEPKRMKTFLSLLGTRQNNLVSARPEPEQLHRKTQAMEHHVLQDLEMR